MGRGIYWAALIGAPPINTFLPAISWTAKVGQTLSASRGKWTGSPTSYFYQWFRCATSGASCASITGATASSYVLVAADAGHTMRVRVVARNSGGATSALSNPTPVVST